MKNNLKTPKNNVKVKVRLINDKVIKGTLNISGYERLSDFLNNNNNTTYLSLYESVYNAEQNGFVLINKNNILFIVED